MAATALLPVTTVIGCGAALASWGLLVYHRFYRSPPSDPVRDQPAPELAEADCSKAQYWLDSHQELLDCSALPPFPAQRKYTVDRETPHEIRDNRLSADRASNGVKIAVLDSTGETPLGLSSPTIGVVASHYELVRRAMEDESREVIAFDIGGDRADHFNGTAKVAALEHLAESARDKGVGVVSLSVVSPLAYSRLEEMRSFVPDPAVRCAPEIAPENLGENRAIVRKIAEHFAPLADAEIVDFWKDGVTHDEAAMFKQVLAESDLVDRLEQSGVAVVQGAGNWSSHFALLSAVNEKVISVYGTVGGNDAVPHPSSSFDTTVSIGMPYSYQVSLAPDLSITLDGTSYATPRAAELVATLMDEGLTPEQVRTKLRKR